MFAVIKTGGKQYLVIPGQKIKIEKISPVAGAKAEAGKENSEIVFDEVLLVEKNNKLEMGTPLVKGAKVTGKIISQGKGKKVIAFKYSAKKRTKVKKGHRQTFSEVEIKEILK
jgi:large subunit ribosomal protein L21